MSSRFWLQQQSKGGNWWDSLGTTKEKGISHGIWEGL